MFKASNSDPDTPTWAAAMSGPHKAEFLAAMKAEITSLELEQHNTWTVVPRKTAPEGANILPGTWAFRIKRYPDGRLRKFKSRYCARGDRQVAGRDYFSKFAPVVSWSTVRLMLCLSVNQRWKTRHVDFSNAFVQAHLDERIYMDLPQGFQVDGEPPGEYIMKLNKSLYGLVQAPMYWFNHLSKTLTDKGFVASKKDPCLFYGRGFVILVYVDDCLFFGPDQGKIDAFIKELQDDGFALTIEDDDVYAFLGVAVAQDDKTGEYTLTQTGLIDKILETTGMVDSNRNITPATTTPLGTDAKGDPFKEDWDYASVIGMLLYLSSNSRSEIQFAVHQCARFTHCPKNSHGVAVKRICRYLAGTRTQGMKFAPTPDLKLDCYVDADYAGLWHHEDDQDPVCVKSRTGYLLTLGGCPLVWVSKLQTEIALSTLEAEYIALSQAMRELLPMRELLHEIGTTLNLTFVQPAMVHSTVFEDNNGTLGLATSPKITPRTKHFAVKYIYFALTLDLIRTSKLSMLHLLIRRLISL
jgi:hypothetical protein